MYVEDITIDGFKSYATRTVVPGFDSQFNAITGLNGSGKSNILDSICFVLGITNLSHVRHRSRVVAVPFLRAAGLRSAAPFEWRSAGGVRMRRTGQRIHRRGGIHDPRRMGRGLCRTSLRMRRARRQRANTKRVRLGRRPQEADGSAGHLRARRTIRATGSPCARLHVGRYPSGKPYDA